MLLVLTRMSDGNKSALYIMTLFYATKNKIYLKAEALQVTTYHLSERDVKGPT